MFECEARREEQTGNHTPALQDQLRLGAQCERGRPQQPSRRGQADADSPGVAEGGHEFSVRERIGRGDVDGAPQLFAIDDPLHRAHEVAVVDPRDVLPSIARPPAQPVSHQPQEHVEWPAGFGTHHDRGAQFDLACQRGVGLIERTFPRLRDVDAETPRVAANDSVLIVRGIEPMPVDGGGAHLQPESRRPDRTRNGLADRAGGIDARFHDFPPIARVVAAVDISPREIDDDVGARQLRRPASESPPIPAHPPAAAQDHHRVPLALKGTRQDAADVTGTACDDNLHIRHL